MSFRDEVRAFAVVVEQRDRTLLFANIASAVQGSIVDGSEITGSPGQPVGQYGPGYNPGRIGGALKASWQIEFGGTADAPSAAITTDSPYAIEEEDGERDGYGAIRHRSDVGGFHSVALTIAGFDRIVASEAQKVA